MTYHKKGLQPQSPGLFYWVLEEKIKVEGRVGDSPFFFFFLSCGLEGSKGFGACTKVESSTQPENTDGVWFYIEL